MSDNDLRPPVSSGYRPTAEAEGPARRRWWETLPFRLGMIVLLALLGLAFGYYRGRSSETGLNVQPLLSESERPQRLEAMRSTVAAFYATPNDDTQKAAREAVVTYRRTFADALPLTLQASTEKTECGQTQECEMIRQRKNNEHIALATQMYNKYPSLSLASTEFHTKIVLDYALERRITVTVPVAMIDDDGKRFKAEQELAPLRERFFNDLDKALQGDKTIGQKDVLAYLDVYARASESTFKPVKRDQTCPVNQSSTADGRLCAAASTAVNTAHYGGRDLAARVAITKKVIADRDAPLEIMKNGITQLFNVK